MKTLYLDIFSGISGDMFLGAMLDLGVDLQQLERELDKLGLPGFHLHAHHSQNSQIRGIKFDVHIEADHTHGGESTEHEHSHHHHHHHEHEHEHEHGHDHPEAAHEHHHSHRPGGQRDFAAIRQLIEQSALSDWVKRKAVAVFQRIAVAEGKIHGCDPEEVHFHEVGAIDSIVDVVGACVALELMGRPRVLSGPVVDGTGWVDCAHGRFPVPAPATLEILGARGVAVIQCEEPQELVTPTGAALLAEFAETFGRMEGLAPTRIGYGLGTRQNKTRPNVLRAILSEAVAPTELDWESDSIAVLETNLDDCTAEILGYVAERALAAGALDIFHTPVQMKKNRPGVLLTILCAAGEADKFTELLLRETTAFGVRRHTAERRKLQRQSRLVQTPYGEITAKLGLLNGKVLHSAPEFESCKALAAAAKVPLKTVYESAIQALRQIPSDTAPRKTAHPVE
jgi:pyridinium-3,5-bisthiocarboxylic acid mononucleotide nickel chelatase